jgi:hypothetical protein
VLEFKVIDRRRVTAAGRVELLTGVVYFDASAWNRLADHANRAGVTAGLRRRNARVIASVISAGEILKTPTPERRALLAEVIRDLNPDLPLFEDPLALAGDVARAALRGESDALLRQSGPGRTLLEYLHRPDAADQGPLSAWLANKENNLERFRQEVEGPLPEATRYHSLDVLKTDAFLRLLLKLPPAVELELSLSQVRRLYEGTDVWRAWAGALGYALTQIKSKSPLRQKRRRRPGAADLWQAVYLGVADVFVTGDERQLEAVREISSVLRYPRCVVHVDDFFAGVETDGSDPTAYCSRCGSALRTLPFRADLSFHQTA